MQTKANTRFFMGFSLSKKLAGSILHPASAGLYQLLTGVRILGGGKEIEIFHNLGNELIALAQHAYALRQFPDVEVICKLLKALPAAEIYREAGLCYEALCLRQRGGANQSRHLLESLAESGTLQYRAKALFALGTHSYAEGDHRNARSLYAESMDLATRDGLASHTTLFECQRSIGIITSLEGDHKSALRIMEELYPFAMHVRRTRPDLFYHFLNSLAVLLSENNRLEEAGGVSSLVLKSPYARVNPAWAETKNEIQEKMRARTPSRSFVSLASVDQVEDRGLTLAPPAPGACPAAVSPVPPPAKDSETRASVYDFASHRAQGRTVARAAQKVDEPELMRLKIEVVSGAEINVIYDDQVDERDVELVIDLAGRLISRSPSKK